MSALPRGLATKIPKRIETARTLARGARNVSFESLNKVAAHDPELGALLDAAHRFEALAVQKFSEALDHLRNPESPKDEP